MSVFGEESSPVMDYMENCGFGKGKRWGGNAVDETTSDAGTENF